MSKFLTARLLDNTNNPFIHAYAGDIIVPERNIMLGSTSPAQVDTLVQLVRDEKVLECLAALVSEIMSCDLLITPLRPNVAIDVEAAEFCYRQVEPHIEGLINSMVTSVFTGISLTEIIYGRKSDAFILDRLEAKDVRRLVYKTDYKPYLYYDRDDIRRLPRRKMIIHHHWAVPSESPYGFGHGEIIGKTVMTRQQLDDFLSLSAERNTSPACVGKYPSGADDDDILKFFDFMRNMSQNPVAAIPDDYDLSFVLPPTNGMEALSKRMEACDATISLALIGESTAGKNQPSTYAKDYVSAGLRTKKALGLSRTFCHTTRLTLLRYLTELNFPGAGVPQISFSFREPTDERLLEKIKILSAAGYQINPDYIAEQLGIPVTLSEASVEDQPQNEATPA